MIWLYNDFTVRRKIDTRGLTQIASLEFKNNSVKRKLSNSIVWDIIDVHETLFLKDSILTLDDSEALIRLDSGSKIEISPNSLIVLEKVRDSLSINFLRGNLYTDTKGSDLKIRMNNNDITLRDGVASISEKSINVFAGTADIKGQKIQKGEQGKLLEDGLLNIEKNIFNILSPQTNERFLTALRQKNVKFEWVGENLSSVNLKISKDLSFKNLIYNRNHKNNSVNLPLDIGVYYFKLSTNINNETKSSIVHKISIIYEKPTQIINPRSNEIFKYRSGNYNLKIRWNASNIQKDFEVEISEDNEFKEIRYRKKSIQNHTLISVEEGSYYLRVKSFNAYRTAPLESDIIKFEVNRVNEIATPVLLSPSQGKVFFKQLNKEERINFSWEAIEGALGYKILISRDIEMKSIFREINRKTTSFTQKLYPHGKYYWSVRAIDELKGYSKSTNGYFVIKDMALISLMEPENDFEKLKMSEEEQIVFKWEGTENVKYYRLYIFREIDSFVKPGIFEIEDDFQKKLNLPDGKYSWRVDAYDIEGSLINTSKLQKFSIKTYSFIRAPLLLAPLDNGEFEFIPGTLLTFRWKNIETAKAYRFALYKNKEGDDKFLYKKETNENFISVQIPEIGIYAWVVNSIDNNNVASEDGKSQKFSIIEERPLKAPSRYNINIE